MKKVFIFFLFLFWCRVAGAQMPYLDEIRALGAIAGQGMACGASKYDTFEMLARAILISKSPSDGLQGKAMYAYNEEKATAYMSKQMDGLYGCDEINHRFNAQQIFQAVLYDDGTVQMPDGQIITPRRPYDANFLYKKDKAVLDKAKAIYDGTQNAKILKVDIKNAPNQKIPLPSYDTPRVAQVRATHENTMETSVKHIRRKN